MKHDGVMLKRDLLVIAHRGASRSAPENTLPAFVAACGLADVVEFDVRLTSDRQLVVMHDERVERTTDGHGRVADMSLEQIVRLDAGGWFSTTFAGTPVPTLEQAVRCVLPAARPLIERKSGPARAYIDALRRLQVERDVILQSFDWAFLREAHALAPEIVIWALGSDELNMDGLRRAADAGATALSWRKEAIGPSEVRLAHSQRMALIVWTVDDSELTHYAEMGVDGLITNVRCP